MSGGPGTGGGAFAVDPSELARCGAVLAGETARLEETLLRCQRTVDALRGVWQGGAHTRYEVLYAEWQRGAQSVRHALEGVATMTTRAADIYGQGEQGVAAMIGGG